MGWREIENKRTTEIGVSITFWVNAHIHRRRVEEEEEEIELRSSACCQQPLCLDPIAAEVFVLSISRQVQHPLAGAIKYRSPRQGYRSTLVHGLYYVLDVVLRTTCSTVGVW
jgi:hypothetical protein